VEEIANLAAETGKPAETLMNVVALIARRFGTDVCSAYLLEPTAPIWFWPRPSVASGMRWQAAHGGSRRARRAGRGTGSSVAVEQVRSHPRFKYFPEAGEDTYHSFWSSPH